MFSSTFKRPLVTLMVIAGLLAAAGPASAQGGLIVYNGHAGLGAGWVPVSEGEIQRVRIVTDNIDPDAIGLKAGSRGTLNGAYQHNQTDLEFV